MKVFPVVVSSVVKMLNFWWVPVVLAILLLVVLWHSEKRQVGGVR